MPTFTPPFSRFLPSVSDSPSALRCVDLGRFILTLLTVCFLLLTHQQARADNTASTTTIYASQGTNSSVTSIAAGSALTLNATVTAGATSLGTGQIFFCESTVALCDYPTALSASQLAGNGLASFTFIPSPGNHTYKAVFPGTTAYAASSSGNITVAVTGGLATTTNLTASATAPYTLTAIVSGQGLAANPLTGNVTFQDTTANISLGTQTLGAPTSTLSLNAGTSFKLPPAVDWITSGDFNGDGKLDLAVAATKFLPDDGTESAVVLYLGNGDGTFTQGSTTTVSADPNSLIAGDFNGDGKLDIAAVCDKVNILLGNGDGTFTIASTPSAGSSPLFAATGDFNRDGIADLAVTGFNEPMVILLGNGDGTFTAKSGTVSINATSVAVADFNGDGIADLAVADDSASATILLGNGDGTFTTGATPTVVDSTSVVVSGDFNGDGNADLAYSSLGSVSGTSLTILLGKGDGTFSQGAPPTIDIDTNNGMQGGFLAAADFNGDGKTDLVVVDYGSIYELISNGDGSFTESTLPGATTGPNYYTVTAGDFNGDGLADFATQNSDTVLANVYLNQATEQATAVLNKVSIEGSGNHTVQASYAGDTAFAASNATIQLTGATIATSLTITAPATAAYGAQVQATATLAPNAYGSLLTDGELVTFSYNGQSSGTAKLSKGVATYTFTNLAAGSDTLTASYPGDTNFNSSTSSAANITVSAAPTPAVILSPTSLTFAAQAIGTTSATQSVTLTNTGQGTLAITTIAASGPFGETNTCGTSVAPAATCTIAVTYSPTAAQNDTGSITITDNASGSSQSVALTGTGSSFNVTASATQLSIASPGGSATDTLQIAPNSGFSGTVSLSCAVKFTGTGTASDLPTCTLNPASLTLSSGSAGSTTLTVSSTATASSSAKAMVSTGSALAALLLVGFLPRRRWRNSLSIVVLALGFAFSVASLTGCGGSSKSSKTSDSGTTAGSYSVTVTASSTSFTGTATIPLTIQ